MKQMTATELQEAQVELSTFKGLSAWIRSRQEHVRTEEFRQLELHDQLAYMIVTKAGLQVLDQLVTDAGQRWGIDTQAEDGEGKLADVVQLFGERNRVESPE